MIAIVLTAFLGVHLGLGWWTIAACWIVMECVVPGTVVRAANEQMRRWHA